MSAPATTIRPPWPDELTRLADAFSGLALTRPLHLRVLVVPATAGSPERIVGVAALAAPAEGKSDATLAFAVRPRYAPEAPALLAAILAVARAENFSGVITPAQSDSDPRAAVLRGAGFAVTAEPRVWRLAAQSGSHGGSPI